MNNNSPKNHTIHRFRVGIRRTNTKSEEFLSMVRKSLGFYLDKCIGHDEINVENGDCIDEFGFSSTLFESLETMMMLDMKDELRRAIKYLKTSFNIQQVKWCSRRELWTRVIGSLIGAYSISKDNFFLELACNIAENSILHDNEFSRVLNTEGFGKEMAGIKSKFISDFSAGLPELAALFKFTNRLTFKKQIDNILIRLPIKHNKIGTVYNNDTSYQDNKGIDGYIMNFLSDISMFNEIIPNSAIEAFIVEYCSYLQPKLVSSSTFLYPLFQIISYFEQKEAVLMLPVEEDLILHLYNNYKINKNRSLALFNDLSDLGYKFEGDGLRELIRKSSKDTKIMKLFIHILEITKRGRGFSSLMKSTKRKIHHTNIQSSNLFGQFFGLGSIVVSGNIQVLDRYIINSRGHLLIPHIDK